MCATNFCITTIKVKSWNGFLLTKLFVQKAIFVLLLFCPNMGLLIWAYLYMYGYLKVKAHTFLFPSLSLSLSTEVHFKHHNRLRASLVEFNDALYSVLQSKYRTTTQINKKYWRGIILTSFGHLKINGLFFRSVLYLFWKHFNKALGFLITQEKIKTPPSSFGHLNQFQFSQL